MLIEKDKIEDLADLLAQEQEMGYTWVAFNSKAFPRNSPYFFKTHKDAVDFCIKEATFDETKRDTYFIRDIGSLFETISKWIYKEEDVKYSNDYAIVPIPKVNGIESANLNGVYLPHVMEDVERTGWMEYKAMGLTGVNRHESRWWEVNGTYDIDRVNYQLETLYNDKETRQFVEHLFKKTNLFYPEHPLSVEQRTAIQSEFSMYFFKEITDPAKLKEIVDLMELGETCHLTLVRNLDPAIQINQYVVVEHLYPKGIVYEYGHSIRELKAFSSFDDAVEFLRTDGALHLSKTTDRVNELLLIGQYADADIKYTYDGAPQIHTGLHVATAFGGENSPLEIVFLNRPYDLVEIQESVNAYLGSDGKLQISHKQNDYDIDLSFWKRGNLNLRNETLVEDIINSNLKFKAMSVEKNIESLQYQAKIMGHGTKYNNEIATNVRQGQPKFEISGMDEYYQGTRKLTSVLNYKKGGENYFWNSYDATLVTAQGKETKQKFYVETRKVNDPDTGEKVPWTQGFTTKEACNLLDSDDYGNSRAVCKVYFDKDGDPYMAWKKLNLNAIEKGNHPYESYQVYDIKKAVQKHGFLEDLDEVVESLCKGNLHAVTDPNDKDNSRRFIAADPAKEDIIIYDRTKKLIYQNDQETEHQAVKYRRDDSAPVQETTEVSNGQAAVGQVIPANGQPVSEGKEPLLSNGNTNKSQDDKGQSHSKKNNQDLADDKPLLDKAKKNTGSKKNADKSAAPPKNGPGRGKGGDLMTKNRTSSKNQGAGAKR